MKRILFLLTASLLLGLGRPTLAADSYALDKSHSSIGFSVDHMLISTVDGSFGDFATELSVDPADVSKSSVKAVIQVASITTANEKRDEHLRSADFFDAAKFPTITFVSKKIVKKGSLWVATGDFTMRGVTKSIELPFKLNGPIKDPWGSTRIGVQATLTLNRQDYGVSWSKTMDEGGLVVGDEVQVKIQLEATKK
jgi:polyisoprenoid-binding protein YceI